MLFSEFIIECNYLNFARGKQVINWWLGKETVKYHFSFVQRQILKILFRQSNPRIYKPTNLLILRKPRKLNPTNIKYFTVVGTGFNMLLLHQYPIPFVFIAGACDVLRFGVDSYRTLWNTCSIVSATSMAYDIS